MTFIPAYKDVEIDFLLQFRDQYNNVVVPANGTFVCDFYADEFGPVTFSFTSAANDGLSYVAGNGIRFRRDLATVTVLEERTYNWRLIRLGTPNTWLASGEMVIGTPGGIGSRVRVFETYNGSSQAVIAPAVSTGGGGGSGGSFSSLTGDPVDNTALAAALSGKLGVNDPSLFTQTNFTAHLNAANPHGQYFLTSSWTAGLAQINADIAAASPTKAEIRIGQVIGLTEALEDRATTTDFAKLKAQLDALALRVP